MMLRLKLQVTEYVLAALKSLLPHYTSKRPGRHWLVQKPIQPNIAIVWCSILSYMNKPPKRFYQDDASRMTHRQVR